ncbi:MAG TPA: PIN domain-containing protein [Candidatus Hydrogenedentes bacterium]|nr:PIN domain-containing protein [Candidatus Hydrogenedentota bacterium]HNT86250.1 PIN domain-containing protein [Candidatus Hydrogenedentota bacterium]
MKRVFVDSNVFLRFLTRDEEGQHASAARLFREAARGKVGLVTGPPVFFEVAWTLRTAYGASRESVLQALLAALSLPALEVVDATLVHEAIARARRDNQEFADAYIAALAAAQGCDSIATFNRKHFSSSPLPLYDL